MNDLLAVSESPPRPLGATGAGPGRPQSLLLLGTFTASVFTSAALLFLVQPMVSKMVLPQLGGTAAVWNTCMLFFQAMLLLGYLYAHLTPRWLGVQRQARVHLTLLAAALLFLPIAITGEWMPRGGESPTLWLLGTLAASIGVPFFVLSSNGPLLQKWFSHTGHPDAHNPYFLYAASNLGSMLALLGYPVVMEPLLRLARQSWVWSAGYLVLVALIGGCVLLLRGGPGAENSAAIPHTSGPGPAAAAGLTAGRRVRWVLLSFVPSSLLLGVTTYLTTDVAAVPLLWVIPLALYLLTFTLVFSRRPLLRHGWMIRAHPLLIIPLLLTLLLHATEPVFLLYPLHLAGFFVTVMVLHGELAADRPEVNHLTEFYLWISVGGVLGGVFNVLMAPTVFDTVAEYPLALVLAALLRPWGRGVQAGGRARLLDVVLPVCLALGLLGLLWAARGLSSVDLTDSGFIRMGFAVAASAIAIVLLASAERPLRFGLGLGAVMLAGGLAFSRGDVLAVDRSFFGVLQVVYDSQAGFHRLQHGSTIHGIQSLDPVRRLEPLSYYGRTGPLGDLFEQRLPATEQRKVAVVGLGTGTILCYGQAGEEWVFYEIDPVVERIARDPRYFTYFRDCPARGRVVIGDGRTTLAAAAAGAFDLIILDAFSSDAIPVHLLTREALALYRDKLAEGGILAFHISNRHLDLGPVLARLVQDAGMAGIRARRSAPGELAESGLSASDWVVLARREADLGTLRTDPGWTALDQERRAPLWTDDYSNILSVYRWHR